MTLILGQSTTGSRTVKKTWEERAGGQSRIYNLESRMLSVRWLISRARQAFFSITRAAVHHNEPRDLALDRSHIKEGLGVTDETGYCDWEMEPGTSGRLGAQICSLDARVFGQRPALAI